MVQKDKYAVIACPNCEYVRVVQQKHQTSKCGRCGKQSQMKKLKKFVTTNSNEKARLVASEIRAKQSGMEDDFMEAYENGEMDMSQYSGIKGPADWLNEEDTDDERSDETIVRDSIAELENPTRDNIIQHAEKDGVDAETVNDILSRLRQQTEVLLQSDGTFREL